MAKRKISALIDATEHPLNLETKWNQEQPDGTYHAYAGDDIEAFLKKEISNRTPTEELVSGETKAPTSGVVFDAMVGTVTDIDVADSQDGTQYVMTVTQKSKEGGEETKEIRFSKYTDDDKVVVNIDLTDAGGSALPASQYLALGTGFAVKYAVSVATAGGSDVDGYSDLKARVIIKRGSTVITEFQNAEFVGVTAGESYNFDASPYLKEATAYTVQVEAQCVYNGETLMKTATARVTMVAMEMSTTYSAGNGLSDGGYKYDVNIPFTVKGTSGEKNIYYRINGGTPFTVGLSSGSGVQQKNVTIPLSGMAVGLNIIEAYAIHESSGVMSRVFYISLMKAGEVSKYVGMMFSHVAEGFQKDYRNPVLNAEQFNAWEFTYGAYDKENTRASVQVKESGKLVKEDLLNRGDAGSFGKTNVNTEALNYTVSCGAVELPLKVVTSSHPDIEATLSPDAVCSFDAFGRTNSESDPSSWKSGDMYMKFENVLWAVNEYGAGSGWHDDQMLLSNGAKMTLTAEGGYHPFNDAEKPEGYSIRDVGMTLEIEYATGNVTNTSAELISCLGQLDNGNRYGLVVTPEEAKFLTGVVTEAMDAGQVLRYEDSVGTKFEPGKSIHITYVFYPNVQTNEQRTLIGFYVNGEEGAASKWVDKVNFDILKELVFSSEGSDLNVKRVRIYNKALTNDEVLNNYIVSRNHLDDNGEEKGVRSLDEENRVLDEGDKVSMQKLMNMIAKRKNSILVLIGSGSVGSETPSESDTLNIMDALAQLNNKKANKLCREVRFYNGENRDLDWIARDIYLRIQGTSSVNYARKNLRFYFQKTASEYTARMAYGEIDSNGKQNSPAETTGKKNLFKPRKNSIGAKLACAKCDFSDSSMTTNTGGAKLINDGLKEMGLLTPAQRYAKDHGLDNDFRSAIDGLPCDLFVAKSADEDLIYYGQYNMNNEKSDSYPIFGMGDTIGEEKWGEGDTLNYLEADDEGHKQYLPICFETLNNSNPLCLFHWLPSTEPNHQDFMDYNFDGGLEFNHPKDTFWADGGGDAEEEPNMKDHLGKGDVYDKMYKATDRMMSFVYRCVKETPAGKSMTYSMESHAFEGVDYEDDGDKFPADKWKSDTFKKEASKYFDLPYMIAYYLYVQFNLGVDQLAKNMLIRTWDGVKWLITYYDGDCQLGSDNKSFLTGKYNDNRQTKRDGAYVMQGHNSWLWNLVVANCWDMIVEIMVNGWNGGASFMSAFSIQKAVDYFDTLQMGRWCSRLYNKSGVFKYVYPFLNEMPVGADGAKQTYPQIYGLKGSLKAHRSYFIRRRYDLKQVEYGYVSTLGAQFYQSTASLDAGYKLKPMQFVLTIPYRVQLSTSNGVQADSGVVEADKLHTLSLSRAFGENDPLKIIGAGKIKELIWHEDAFAIGFNFGLFTSLVKLDMSVDAPGKYRNGSFMASTNGMLLLEELNMRNNLLARNGDNGNMTVLDLRRQSRLKRIDVRGTGVTRLQLATGSPIAELSLPGTIEELFLENLPKLTDDGLVLEAPENIKGYRFAGCPDIDGLAILKKLHEAKQNGSGKLERFSLEVDMEDDGTILNEYFNYGTYTSSGANDNSHSGFRGKVRLNKYLSDAEMQRYRERYPELDIKLPEYTVIKLLEDVTDGTGFSNLDNRTGYDYSNDYEPSGHVAIILGKRHRCLGKKTAEGEMTICNLHDQDSNYFADAENINSATPSILTGEEGDVFVYEPTYWYKGVNDFLRKAKYRIYSSLENEPTKAESVKLTSEKLESKEGYAVRISTSYSTLIAAEAQTMQNIYYTVNVKGYKQVRFPSTASAVYGAVFLDEQDNIIGRMNAVADIGMLKGMYLFDAIPENAEKLAFTVDSDAPFDYVLLTKSKEIEAIEPDWCKHEECLTAVYEAYMKDNRVRSISGVESTGSKTQPDLKHYAEIRGKGYSIVDWEMHKDVANLYYSKYGNTDSHGTCGYGTNNWNRRTGLTNKAGMRDTTAKSWNPTEQNAYIIEQGSYIPVNSPSVMGYENWQGNKAEWIKDTFNEGKVDYSMHITMPDGAIRKVKGEAVAGDRYPKYMVHGRYMDIWVAKAGGSTTTCYFDNNYVSNAASRVVYRSHNNADAFGGVACANAYNDASGASAHVGSRLAFRGKIVRAQSVAAFKAINEVA